MTDTHTHYPYYGEAVTSFTSYFQAIIAAIAGYALVSPTGPVVRASSSSLTIPACTYMAGTPATISYAGATLSGVTAATSGKHRYDWIYLDTSDGTAKREAGTEDTPTSASDFLENLAPQPPDLPSETAIPLAVICVDDSGIVTGDFGSYAVAGVADMHFRLPCGAHLLSYLYASGEAQGDLIARGASAWARLALGASGKYLRSDGTDPIWDDVLISSLTIASQARGDLATRGASAWGRLGAGAQYKYLMSNGASADLSYELLRIGSLDVASQARGDLIMRGVSAWGRFAPGSAGQVLTSAGAGADLVWATPSSGVYDPLEAEFFA